MKENKTSKVAFSLESVVNNPVLKKSLEGFVEEIVLCRMKMKTEKDSIKDIMDEAKTSIGIPGKILNGIVNEKMNPGSIDQKQHDIEEISEFAISLGIKD